MARPSAEAKRLFVTASSEQEKNEFIGSVIYKTGLELTTLKELEKERTTRFDEVVPVMEKNGMELNFHTPSYYCAFVHDPRAADAIVCLLNISLAQGDAVEILQALGIEEALRNGIPLILIDNSTQRVERDRNPYESLIVHARNALEDLSNAEAAIFALIPSANGDNILDISTKVFCYSAEESKHLTAVRVIDKALRKSQSDSSAQDRYR